MSVAFGKRKDGKVYPKKAKSVPGRIKDLSSNVKKMPKRVTIHGLSWAGYVVDYADEIRKKALSKAVEKYGKGEVMQEMGLLRAKYEGKGDKRLQRVVDSDLAYLAKGNFEES